MKKQIKLLWVLLFMQCLTVTTLRGQVGLIAWYPFNGNAHDETGNGYNGTVSGATLSDDRFGNPISAYSFNGINDKIVIGKEPNFPSWDTYAVSLWFLNNGGGDQGQGYGQKILSKAQFFTDFHLSVLNNGSQGHLSWWSAQGGFNAVDATNQDYRDNKWHHVVLNKHSPGEGDIWVDGILQNSSNTLQAVFNSEDLVIGFTTHGDGFQQKYWSGKIDDIRIYNRVLSASEISTLYTEGGYCPTPVFYRDADADGYGDAGNSIQSCSPLSGYVNNSTDCNDNNAATNPAATEVPDDSVDNNCNGIIDEVNIANNIGNQSWQDPAFWQAAGLNGVPDSTSVINISGSASGNLNINGNADMKSLIIDSSSSVTVSFGTNKITIHDGELSAPRKGSVNAEQASLVVKGNTKLNLADRVKDMTIDAGRASSSSEITLKQDVKVTNDLALKSTAVQLAGGKQIAVDKNMQSSSEVTGDGKISFTGSETSTISASATKSQGKIAVAKDAGAKVMPTTPLKAAEISISTGKLELADQPVTAPVAVEGGAITGRGLIKGDIAAKPPVRVGDKSKIRPGNSPGLITIEGNLDMESTELGFELLATSPGTGYDQIKVIGEIIIRDDVTLDLTAENIPDFEFVIIDNDDTDPVQGRFKELPNNGDTLTISGILFRIYYNGGDGNDVVLKMNDPVPVIDQCSTNISVCQTDNHVEYTVLTNTIPVPDFTYSFSGATNVAPGTPGTGSGSTFNAGITNVIVTATNAYGSANCSFHVEVTNTTWYADADGDGYGDDNHSIQNCSQPQGYISDNTDCNDNNPGVHPGAAEICNGIDDNCNGQIDEGVQMSVSAGVDENTYFGFNADQCVSKTAIIQGGVAPYQYQWTLNRPLLSNVVNSAGDETMTGNNTSITSLCLLDTAEICVKVTDVNGCIANDCVNIFAEDVRCFSGNAGHQKVKVCHMGKTICVDSNAVSTHLVHGDKPGNCLQSANSSGLEIADQFIFKLYPNPSKGNIIIDYNSSKPGETDLVICNVAGKIVFSRSLSVLRGNNSIHLNLPQLHSGIYFLTLTNGTQQNRVKFMINK